ncbi:TraE/TraK family type IV conjugative transfer system protein [Legionella septentrionalis]|uniref:TraE/TraK family type IV conjugative transfer system protein n=1 Tax=Legionella septentrionalis TaxID=2498109 RepID=UPI000F8E2120|nr:TraE/TraK family type IV conjugative transfer system protein [Legionella septentrionalis]RUQ96648.1 conjugal transfer protein TraE [Legionella septentrionalis]
MDTDYRDNAIVRSQLLLKMTLVWALSSSLAVVVLSFLCLYAFKHKQVHWLPVCGVSEFNLSESNYSPSYLKEMAIKVINLRLTYNPETVDSRFMSLIHLIPASRQEAFKKILDAEREAVQEKNISSVFYEEEIAADTALQQVKINGFLYRTSHGLQVKPQYKTYLLTFSFKDGVLWPESVKEIENAKN